MPTETQAITGTTHYFFEPFAQRTVIFHDFVVLDRGVLSVEGAIWTPCFKISNQQRRISKIGIIRRHNWANNRCTVEGMPAERQQYLVS